MIGSLVGHYTVLELLGRGGMGVVFRARDTRLGREVAIKLLPPELSRDPFAFERFRREARLASALSHPHICTIHELGEHEGQQFIVMELLQGRTLRTVIETGALPVERVVELAAQIADALAAAHGKGIVHRDIKPANIFVSDRWQAKVLDFGLAKIALAADIRGGSASTALTAAGDAHLTTGPGQTIGTIAYMSPEQARGEELDARTDLFSFGVVIYEMATGARPFPGNASAVVFDGILNRVPAGMRRVNPAVPQELEAIVARALEKDRERRYPSAASMTTDLQSLKHDTDVSRLTASGQARAGATARLPSSVPAGRRTRRRWWAAAGVGGAIAGLAVAAVVLFSQRTPALTERDVILLADVTNTTGESVFDGTLKQALAVQLEQSPFLNLYPDPQIRETLRFMSRSPDERITPALALEICQRAGLKAVITGSIAPLGRQYVISLGASRCESGQSLAREQVEAEGKERVLTALGEAAARIRERLGESLASIRRFDTPPDEATTPSLEALKAFTVGNARRAERDLDAIPFFERALELDPGFAMAYARLAAVYENSGEHDRAGTYMLRAFELRERVSEREKYYITAAYYTAVTGELEKAFDAYQLWRQAYPRDWVPINNMALIDYRLGRFTRSVEESRAAMQLNGRHPFPYQNLGSAYVALGRVADAAKLLDQMVANRIGAPSANASWAYELAYLQHDVPAMARAVEACRGTPDEPDLVLMQARAAFAEGRIAAGEELIDGVLDALTRGRGGEVSGGVQFEVALVNATVGRTQQARRRAAAALTLTPGRRGFALASILAAQLGDSAEARGYIERASRAYGDDTVVQNVVLPVARALVAVSEGHPDQALVELRPAQAYEISGDLGVKPVFVAGLAHLAANRSREAIATFERVYDRAIVEQISLTPAMSQLQLARALAMGGDFAAARSAYDRFFAAWTKADPDLPVLQAAKREFAHLGKTE